MADDHNALLAALSRVVQRMVDAGLPGSADLVEQAAAELRVLQARLDGARQRGDMFESMSDGREKLLAEQAAELRALTRDADTLRQARQLAAEVESGDTGYLVHLKALLDLLVDGGGDG